MTFEPHEAVAVVFGSETLMLLPFVLEHALRQLSSDSDVQGVASAGHNVSKVAALVHGMHHIRKDASVQ
jgi:hypothetical protein